MNESQWLLLNTVLCAASVAVYVGMLAICIDEMRERAAEQRYRVKLAQVRAEQAEQATPAEATAASMAGVPE